MNSDDNSDRSDDKNILACVFHGAKDLRLTQSARPALKTGEVRIRMKRAGICGSDIHYFKEGRVGRFEPRRPFILGHEVAGEIIEATDGLTPLGTRVAVDPSMPCRSCNTCSRGRYNLCPNMKFLGSASCDPHIDGGFAEELVVPDSCCHVLPEGLDWASAAMTEPLSVALHAARRAGPLAGKDILVTGGGAIGQLTALVARWQGAARIVMSDVKPGPGDLAEQLGADAAIDPDTLADDTQGFDIVFEASGAPAAVNTAFSTVRRGGRIIQIGTLPSSVSVPLNDLMANEIDYLGSFRFANVFPIALRAMASGRIDVKPLVQMSFPLIESTVAMDCAVGRDDVVKVQITG